MRRVAAGGGVPAYRRTGGRADGRTGGRAVGGGGWRRTGVPAYRRTGGRAYRRTGSGWRRAPRARGERPRGMPEVAPLPVLRYTGRALGWSARRLNYWVKRTVRPAGAVFSWSR